MRVVGALARSPAAQSFYAGDEYRPYLARRRNTARNALVLVAGEDVNRVKRM
jgi:hypothetical protein